MRSLMTIFALCCVAGAGYSEESTESPAEVVVVSEDTVGTDEIGPGGMRIDSHEGGDVSGCGCKKGKPKS
jgi:hypothetical protein